MEVAALPLTSRPLDIVRIGCSHCIALRATRPCVVEDTPVADRDVGFPSCHTIAPDRRKPSTQGCGASGAVVLRRSSAAASPTGKTIPCFVRMSTDIRSSLGTPPDGRFPGENRPSWLAQPRFSAVLPQAPHALVPKVIHGWISDVNSWAQGCRCCWKSSTGGPAAAPKLRLGER